MEIAGPTPTFRGPLGAGLDIIVGLAGGVLLCEGALDPSLKRIREEGTSSAGS